MKTPLAPALIAGLALLAHAPTGLADGPPKPPVGQPVASEARAFAHEAGVVELLVVGPAARTLYDRLPGAGQVQACGASGLHKGDGQITCRKDEGEYVCRLWIDARKQSLTDAETDDC